jgi:hypothetical protein
MAIVFSSSRRVHRKKQVSKAIKHIQHVWRQKYPHMSNVQTGAGSSITKSKVNWPTEFVPCYRHILTGSDLEIFEPTTLAVSELIRRLTPLSYSSIHHEEKYVRSIPVASATLMGPTSMILHCQPHCLDRMQDPGIVRMIGYDGSNHYQLANRGD